MIGLSAIWFILFIVYAICVVSKIIKEEPCIKDGLKTGSIFIIIFVAIFYAFKGIGYLIGYVVGYITGDCHNSIIIGEIVGLSIFGIIVLGICVYGIYYNLKD